MLGVVQTSQVVEHIVEPLGKGQNSCWDREKQSLLIDGVQCPLPLLRLLASTEQRRHAVWAHVVEVDAVREKELELLERSSPGECGVAAHAELE